MNTKTTLRTIAFIALATLSVPALAVFPTLGTGTVNFSGTDFNCTNPADDGPDSGSFTLTFSNQNTTTGSFDVAASSPGDNTLSGSGNFTSLSQLQFQIGGINNDGGDETVNVDVTLVDATNFTFTYSGSEIGGPGCSFSGTGSGVLASTGSIVTPEVAPSTAVTSNTQTLTTVVTTTTSFLGARIQGALKGSRHASLRQVGPGFMAEASGLSAGDTFNNIGVWASYSYSRFDNDFFRTKYDGNRYMVFAGVDFTPRDNMVLGIAIGYEDASIDTDFNNGELDADGWTVAPYFGMTLNDTWSVDVSAGFSNIDTDQDRSFGTITSDVDTDRWFFSANINGFTQVNNWLLSGRAGLLNAESKDDDFTESNGTVVAKRASLLTQFNIGGEAAYSMGEFEPFVSATYNKDLHATETVLTAGAQPSNDNDDVLLGLGFRYYGDNVSITTQLDSRLGRSDFDENTLTVNARWDF